MHLAVNRFVHHRAGRRALPKKGTRFPFLAGANRSYAKTAPAIGAHIVQDLFDTIGAEGTFKTADARLGRIGRQESVAVLTARFQDQHDCSPLPVARYLDCRRITRFLDILDANIYHAGAAYVGREACVDGSTIIGQASTALVH